MPTLLVAAILVGFIVAVCLLLVTLDNKQKAKYRKRILQRFSTEGIQNNLSFSSQEFFANGMIGVDGLRRKLLFLEGKDKTEFDAVVINLAEVKRCSVKKQFALVDTINVKERKPEPYLEKIVLCFEFAEKSLVEIPFFHHITHSISLASALEIKAGHWEMILSKIIRCPQEQRA